MPEEKKQPSWQSSVDWAQKEMDKLPLWLRDALAAEDEARNVRRAATAAQPAQGPSAEDT